MPWFAVYTKPRNEKKVVENLIHSGFEAYVPLVKQKRKWSDRIKTVELPLIPSYVFVNISEKERHNVFVIPGIVRYVFWLGQPAIIKDEEIEALKQSLKEPIYDFRIEDLHAGMTYEISKGPFSGHEGIVSTISRTKLQLIIASLNIKVIITKNV